MTARNISLVLKEKDSLETKVKQEPQTNFAKFKEIREAHRIYFGELSDEMVEKAGEALKTLLLKEGYEKAMHVYMYYHLKTQTQLRADKRYGYLIKAMYFAGM